MTKSIEIVGPDLYRKNLGEEKGGREGGRGQLVGEERVYSRIEIRKHSKRGRIKREK